MVYRAKPKNIPIKYYRMCTNKCVIERSGRRSYHKSSLNEVTFN